VIALRADGLVVFVPQLHLKALVRLQTQDGSLALPEAFWRRRAQQLHEAQPRGSLVVEGRSLRVTDAVDGTTLASFQLLQRVRSLTLFLPPLPASRIIHRSGTRIVPRGRCRCR
jgi:hypothetical protein